MAETETVRNMVDREQGRDLLTLENGHMDRFFKALSDRTRRSILMSLETGEQTSSVRTVDARMKRGRRSRRSRPAES